MKIKFKGEWYTVRSLDIEKGDRINFIPGVDEPYIEDVEINGRHLGKEGNFPTNAAGVETDCAAKTESSDTCHAESDGAVFASDVKASRIAQPGVLHKGSEVLFINFKGEIAGGTIIELRTDDCDIDYKEGLCCNARLSDIVDCSIGCDVQDAFNKILRKQVEYWKRQASRREEAIFRNVDWEQRVWELAIKIYDKKYALNEYTFEESIRAAKQYIETYRKKMKS